MGSLKGKDNILQIVGKNIKAIRISKGMTQEQLAEKLNRSTNYVSLIELGKSGMNAPTIIDICNILNVSSDSIFKGLLDYKTNNNDKILFETISTLSDEDKDAVTNLVEYIIKKNGK